MSIWGWWHEFNRVARETNDQGRIELSQLFFRAQELVDTDRDQALALLDQGKVLAARLNEPWWVLFFTHWRLLTMDDSKLELEIAIPAIVEARKPQYKNFPQRVCLAEDAINAYMAIDPHGYAPLIQETLEYMAGEVTPEVECYFCQLAHRTDFEIELGRLDLAEVTALRRLAALETSTYSALHVDHYSAGAYADLCSIAYRRGDWDALLRWAQAGEPPAVRRKRSRMILTFLGWQTLVARYVGDEASAGRLYRRAIWHTRNISTSLPEDYYTAICAYHELNGRFDLALRQRERELAGLVGRWNTGHECRCRVAICRLLKLLGKRLDAELAAARAIAQHLKDPAPVLVQLAAIELGNL